MYKLAEDQEPSRNLPTKAVNLTSSPLIDSHYAFIPVKLTASLSCVILGTNAGLVHSFSGCSAPENKRIPETEITLPMDTQE